MAKRLHLGKENLVYLILWVIMFLTPVFTHYLRTMSNSGMTFNWNEVFHIWKIYMAYLVVFLIHNFLLAPILIHKHKTLLYFVTTFCLVTVFAIYHYATRPPMHHHMGPHKNRMEMRHEGHRPPHEGRPDMMREAAPPPIPMHAEDSIAPGDPDFAGNPAKEGGPRKEEMPPMLIGEMDVVGIIVIVLLLGMNIGIKLYFKSDERLKELKELEKRNLEQQLEYLKFQINPHFFMNTLNNIHALVDIDPEKAKTTILELSKLMRYVLYEGAKQIVPLSRDIEFLNNYIALMRLRFSNKVKINIDVPTIIPETTIPPMLFITFVENAFKHGVSYQQESFIDIKMDIDEHHLNFVCRNSKHPESTAEYGGVGLANVKQRLELIYREQFTLQINDEEQEYNVSLTIPLQSPVA